LWTFQSQSSVLTDDEGRDGHSSRSGIEKTIRAVYSQKVDLFCINGSYAIKTTQFHIFPRPKGKLFFFLIFLHQLLTVLIFFTLQAEHPSEDDVNGGLYAVMRSELRNAVEEIRMELGQVSNLVLCRTCQYYVFNPKFGLFFVMFAETYLCSLQVMQAMVKTKTSDSESCLQSNDSDVVQAVSSIRRNYSTKLEQVFQTIFPFISLMVIGNFVPWCSTLVYKKSSQWSFFLS
jgi:hypothetical protein